MKRTLSLILSLLIVFSLFSGMSISAAEDDLAETGASYGLWVGSTQVTDANKNDILGDGGKAKFDPSTDTLTLNNPTITGEHNESTIFCNGFDLTVKGSYAMTAAQSCNALTVFDYGLTLDGNFTFLAWSEAVEASYDINVAGGSVVAKLVDSAYPQYYAFCSDVGNLIFGDNVEYFEAEITDTGRTSCAISYDTDGTVTVGSNLKLTDPEDGRFRDGACVYTEGTKQKWAKRVVLASTSAHLGGTVGTINWEYDPAEKVFQAVGTGVFDRDADYNGYLDSAKTIKIGSGVTAIADDVIRDNNNVQKAVLASTIEKLGRNNFSNCPNLSEINFPDSLHYIMSGCFSGSGLQKIEIPNTVWRIDDGSFSNMPSLTEVRFAYDSINSSMIVGDDCFAHLPMMQTLLFGDGPAYIGERSFCDMPQLTSMNRVDCDGYIGIRVSPNLQHIGDETFSDLPLANYNENGWNVAGKKGNDPNTGLIRPGKKCQQVYEFEAHPHYVGKKSFGFVNGTARERIFVTGFASSMTNRYGWANNMDPLRYLADEGLWSMTMLKRGDATRDGVLDSRDVDAITEYVTNPLQIWNCGNEADSDNDISGKVDNRDLIALKQRLAIGDDFEPVTNYSEAITNICDRTGLKLAVDSATGYDKNGFIRVPVTAVENDGYISGTVTAKWDAEALELVDIEYNDELAPKNGTPAIQNNRYYDLYFGSKQEKVDYSGEQVIRFGNDLTRTNFTGTGTMFTLVFRAKSKAKLNKAYEIRLKHLEIVDRDGEEPMAIMTKAGSVTLTEPVYDLWLGDTQVTSKNKDDILNDGGKAKYDPATNTLTLKNPTISGVLRTVEDPERYPDRIVTCKIFSNDSDLTVKGNYTMADEDAQYGIYLYGLFHNLTFSGSFSFKGKNLAVNNQYGILNVASGSLTATSASGDGIYCAKLTAAADTRIEAKGRSVAIYYQNPPELDAGLKLTTPAGGSIKDNGVYESDGTTIASHALLDATNKPSYTVTYDTNGRGVAPVVQYVISGETVSKPADPTFEGWEFLGWYTDKACTAAFDYSTKITKNLTLYAKWSPLESTLFDLWVGSTQVTSKNKDDILNDGGKAKYDPATNTLTLKNPTISGVHNTVEDPERYPDRIVTCKIFSNDSDLTVKGNYTMTDEDAQYGIYLYGLFHNLTFSGSFSFKGKNLAVNNEYGFLTVSSGSLTATSASGDGIYCAKLIADADTRIEAKGGRSVAIYYQNSPELDAGLKLTTPAGGSIKDNGIYESDGTTIAKHVVIGKIGAAILGDVDRNDDIEIRDATWIQRHTASIDIPFTINKKTADVDVDGEITVMDATAIQYYLANLKTPYPIGETIS